MSKARLLGFDMFSAALSAKHYTTAELEAMPMTMSSSVPNRRGPGAFTRY